MIYLQIIDNCKSYQVARLGIFLGSLNFDIYAYHRYGLINLHIDINREINLAGLITIHYCSVTSPIQFAMQTDFSYYARNLYS